MRRSLQCSGSKSPRKEPVRRLRIRKAATRTCTISEMETLALVNPMLYSNTAELKSIANGETATPSPFNNKLGIAEHANCTYRKCYTEVGEVIKLKRRIGCISYLLVMIQDTAADVKKNLGAWCNNLAQMLCSGFKYIDV